MSSWSESVFEYAERSVPAAVGPMERLWQSCEHVTLFLSADEIARREREAHIQGVHETEARLKREYDLALAAGRNEIALSIAAFEQRKAEYFAQIEGEAVRLALAVARTVIERELEREPALLAKVIRDVLHRIEHGSAVRLRVPETDHEAWRAALAAEPSGLHNIEIVPGPEVLTGQCVVETAIGTTEFDIRARMEEAERALLNTPAVTLSEAPATVQ